MSGAPLREKPLSGRGVARDRGQRLIELVREGGRQFAHQGHPAQARHFLALQTQFQIRFHLCGHVHRHAHQLAELAAIVAQITAARDEPARFAIRSQQPIFDFEALRTGPRALDRGVHRAPIVRMHPGKKNFARKTLVRRETRRARAPSRSSTIRGAGNRSSRVRGWPIPLPARSVLRVRARSPPLRRVLR